MIRLRAKLTDAAASVKGLFGVKSEKDSALQKLEALKVQPGARPGFVHLTAFPCFCRFNVCQCAESLSCLTPALA